MPGWVIFTDVDGSLLDAGTYSFEAARPVLDALRRRGIPLVLCTSKTAAETMLLQGLLGIREPFVVEDGGGIGLPKGYFPRYGGPAEDRGDHLLVPLSVGRAEILRGFARLKEIAGASLRGFSEMTPGEIARATGLDAGRAELAKAREFDEPFEILDREEDLAPRLARAAEELGLRIARGGRFFHLHGETDKGRAVARLKELFLDKEAGIRTIGIGDSPLDLPLLRVVDVAVAVQRRDGSHDPDLAQALPNLQLAPAPGPEGWSRAVQEILDLPPPLSPDHLSASAIQAALRAGRPVDVATALARVSPARRAEIFLQLRVADQTAILLAAPAELAATILADCDSASLRATLSTIDIAAIGPALRLIPPDDLADILLHLTPERARQVEEALDAALLDEVRPLLRFDPDSAGGLMTPRYLSVPEAVSAAKAIEILRRARLGDSPSYVYVVDPGGALVGTLPLRALFLADPRASVRDLASREIVKVTSGTPRAEIVRTFGQYHYASLPVVDERDRLVGIVTADDVLAEMRRTEGRVVHGVTGADPREALKATLAGARSRVPWVTVTLLGGLGCAFIAARFQRTLEEFLVLGLFIPVVLALAESVAAQTISVALSALMGGDIPRAKLARFVAKELLIGAAVGLYAGTAVAFASLLWHGEPRLGLLIGAATGISVAWATLLGVLIPALAVRLRVNPAFASGPLVLALADLSTLGVYLGGATLLLPRGPGG